MRRTILFLACLAGSAGSAGAQSTFEPKPAPPPAPAASPNYLHFVDVGIPFNMQAGFVSTSPAPDGMYYVTVSNMRAINPSTTDYGWYQPSDFHLKVGDRLYYPVSRPNLAALDLSWSGSVPPMGTLVATVTFKVPASVRKADFEFIPKSWFDNSGASVMFCCLNQF